MIDFVRLQNDVQMCLLSAEPLLTVNVKQFRKMVIESEIDFKLVYLTPRMGRNGAGIVVEMPTLSVSTPNVEGPITEVGLSVLVIEVPTINLNAGSGTMLSAEEICVRVMEALHLQMIENTGLLRADSKAVVPATEFQGAVAYRVHFALKGPSGQMRRPVMPSITVDGSNVATMTSVTTDAQIYYTLDESYPAKTGNPKSQVYEGPVQVQSGDVIRAAAYKEGMNIGAVKMLEVT